MHVCQDAIGVGDYIDTYIKNKSMCAAHYIMQAKKMVSQTKQS